MKRQLIFVYNADSNLFSAVTDFAHKILSPSTYHCSLCAVIYGNLSMKQEWKTFVGSLPFSSLFLHKDEFKKQYHQQPALPAVFISTDGGTKEIISKQEIDKCVSLKELKSLVTAKLKNYVQHYHPDIQ